MKSRLYEQYKKEAIPALKEKFGYGNNLAVPRILKVSINIGINARNTEHSKAVELAENTLERITGQKPVRAIARKAISAFKIRENMVVGVRVTLRDQKMYDFLDRLVHISIPRIRDFRGLSPKIVDSTGNLTIGFKEHNVFPEIKSDEMERTHGLEVSISTSAGDYQTGLALFTALGFPFQKKN